MTRYTIISLHSLPGFYADETPLEKGTYLRTHINKVVHRAVSKQSYVRVLSIKCGPVYGTFYTMPNSIGLKDFLEKLCTCVTKYIDDNMKGAVHDFV